ncbi:hypothetical protein [Salipaludibacillus aurantiacus]|uniref:Uncharacterized protein n=1 Tax=Salipaludibacillus aurantiacus TaxID=1601833 RepID=A0A1H9UP75_9BACI|nr:hypothetical protein [Salipaludibacillus aurantiacus]SES11265.1 hypothetical protein SAMN05518684_10881 [Salipaludibacillus aurantiacus]
MRYEIVNEFPHHIIYESEAPFISLYQPTHRHSPENKQDPIVFKRLLRQLQGALKEAYSETDRDTLLKPLQEIEKDKEFWRTTSEGLAILASATQCVVYKIPRPVKELAVAAERLHINPLIRVYQSADQYQVLGLNKNTFRLYEGNRYGFEKVVLPSDVPLTKEEVLGDHRTEAYLSKSGNTGSSAKFFGQGAKKDEIDKDTEKFFRYVDKYVYENYSKPSGKPLILTALKEHHGIFKKLSSNPYLMEEGIGSAFDSLAEKQLREKVWAIIEPIYLEKTKKLTETYASAKANGSGSPHLEEVAQAAVENRIAAILIEDGRTIPGRVDQATGEITVTDTNEDQYGDILGDLTEMAFKKKANVVVLPKERMPSKTGVAAVLR